MSTHVRSSIPDALQFLQMLKRMRDLSACSVICNILDGGTFGEVDTNSPLHLSS